MLNKKATTLSKITALLHTVAQLEESQIDHDWLNLNVDHIHRDVGRSLQQELFAGLAPQALAAMQPEHVRRAKEAEELAKRQAYFNSLPKGEPEPPKGSIPDVDFVFAPSLFGGPKVDDLSSRYGATVLGEQAPVKDHGPPTPEDPMHWRNGAFLDLAEQIDGLRDRGFEITKADYDPSTLDGVSAPITARVGTNPQIHALIRVGTNRLEPYTLSLVRGDDWNAAPLIRSHSTTGPSILRTIDAFLAGTKVALSEVPAAVPFHKAIAALTAYLQQVGCSIVQTEKPLGLIAEACGGFMRVHVVSTGRQDLPLYVSAVNAIKPGEIGGVLSIPEQPMTFETAEQVIKALLAGCWARVPLRVPNEAPPVPFKEAIAKLKVLLAHHGFSTAQHEGGIVGELCGLTLHVGVYAETGPVSIQACFSGKVICEPRPMGLDQAEIVINALAASWAINAVPFRVAIDKLSALLAHQHGCIVATGNGEVIAESRRLALQVRLCESSDAAKPIKIRVTRAGNPSGLEPQAMTFEAAEAAINGLFAG